MDFIDQIKLLGERVLKLSDEIQTEEATKNAFIMPFLQYLGYDIFNPQEVIPEFTADVGIKKGEKVDYAIMMDNHPIILIECKWCKEKLDNHNSQLFRYFTATKARFGILTNGIIYKFFTDLDQPNKMDEKPFLEFNMLDIRENLVLELKKFCKSSFDLDEIVSNASELKYSKEIKNIMLAELNNPSESFVKHFVSKIYNGRATQNVMDKFSGITKKALNQLIHDLINERLKSAILPDNDTNSQDLQEDKIIQNNDDEKKQNEIVTTVEELEGFGIVKSILRNVVEAERIIYKDTVNYFGIGLDHYRKPICRLYFNSKQKYLCLIDENKKENKIAIENLNEIYNYSEKLINVITKIDKSKNSNENEAI